LEAERRHVVILFADVVGYTTFSERFGEEAAFGLIKSLSLVIERAVQVEGGRIQNIVGDGVMVAFGAPAALEDAPLRACRAALAILNGLKGEWVKIEAQYGARPEMRIGISAGPAVFGALQQGVETGFAVLGDTVNLASRLQALASPGTVLLSERAHRLVEGRAEAEFAGEHAIKGRDAPEKVYRLLSVRGDASRFDAALICGLTTLVGRERELDALEQAIAQIDAGTRTVDIVGEPGIGKSRLLHEFRARAVTRRALTLAGTCASDGRETPFRPFIEIGRGAFRVASSDDRATIEGKLEEGLAALNLASDEHLDLLLNLIGYGPSRGALETLDGVLIGLRTRELLRKIVQARARLAPLILLFEDIHWIDSASEALLSSLVAIDTPLQKLLIVHSRRPGYTPPWSGAARVTEVALDPLSDRETSRTQILIGGHRPALGVVLRNLPTLVAVRLRGAHRANALLDATASNPQWDVEGVAHARIDFNRGQLWRLRRRPARARECFERARRIADAQELDGLKRRSEEALARLA
jgi:class 3 adenylate cyclase